MTQDTKTIRQFEQELTLARARIAELEAQQATALPVGGDQRPAGDRSGATRKLLHLFATATTRKGYLDSVRDLLCLWTGCACVGIRLIDPKNQIPYESYRGFGRAFWEQENQLSLDRDQCVCIRVVRGQPDAQDLPYITAGGSFVCNDADRLVRCLDPQQMQRFRGTCIKTGYKSITVLPLRYRSRIIGAIHMADRHLQVFPAGVIEFIETMSPLIGEAVHRFNMEDSLRQSNELLERTFESIDLHLAHLDRDFTFLRVNRGYAEADGRGCESFMGQNYFALYPDSDHETIFRRVVETGEPYYALAQPFKSARDSQHGMTYWDWSLQPVKQPDGCVEGVVLCMVNVTDRERARVALREREVLFRGVFDQTFQFMALLGTDGRELELNRASGELFGSKQPGTGPLFWELPGWGSRKARGRLKHAIAEAARGQFTQYEAHVLSAEGHPLTIDFSVKPVRDTSGTIAYLIAEGRDITLRKQLESQLLEVSSREQRRIGHDLHDVLGQNLTGVAFLNRILEQKLLDKGIPESQDAARVGEGIKQAIAQARALSRSLCPIDQKAEGLMTALQALAHNIAEYYGISCLVESPQPVLISDMAAAMHLYHIVQEAINNAIKHGNADQIRISLSEEGEGFVLSIRDNGSGIPDHPAPTRGMGLNIMKYRAGIIGGAIEVRRHPDGGTVVTCTCRGTHAADTPPKPPEETGPLDATLC